MWREEEDFHCLEVFQAVVITISSSFEDKKPKPAVLLPRKAYAPPRASLPPKLIQFLKEVRSFNT